MKKIKYRPELDGIRAISILLVLLFHIDKQLIPGGFIGVDIFFVLSGFLISKIIMLGINNQTFSYNDFYKRRIKRILPPFYFMILITIILSFFIFLPSDINQLLKSAISTLIFSSNYFFSRGLDYFSANAEEQPLLHTWSLSVEEQFYFLFPIIIYFLIKIKNRNNLYLLLLCVSSFILAEILSHINETKSFSYFSLPTRMGELLIGTLCASTTIKLKRSLFQYIGLSLIISTAFIINENTIFPGVYAFIPCLGVGIIILSENKKTILYKILSSNIITYVGKLSFSLYLFHWPVLAFSRYIIGEYSFTSENIYIILIAIIITSIFSYEFIEKKTRYSNLNFKKSLILFYIVPSVIVLLLTFLHWSEKINFNNYSKNITTYDNNLNICHNKILNNCYLGNGSIKVALFGDSHAAQISYFLIHNKSPYSFYLNSASSCPIFDTIDLSHITSDSIRKRCLKIRDNVDQEIKKFETIFISQKWDQYLINKNNINKIESWLNEYKNKKIIFILQPPEYKLDVLRSYKFNLENKKLENYKLANDILINLAKKYNNVYYLPLYDSLERIDKGIDNGIPLYRDNHHINLMGSKYLLKNINDVQEKIKK
ncbi:acyltransferase [Proteus mirabilis]|uniref:acyltransferase family protein n=1 Tax=Proteus mirabilis TaxID=584 RepID=UPI0021821EAB|nr:acyltransferase family protein [Proteus mirabilis]MCT0099888.1 acyltransferase [Proteus mirabilis]